MTRQRTRRNRRYRTSTARWDRKLRAHRANVELLVDGRHVWGIVGTGMSSGRSREK